LLALVLLPFVAFVPAVLVLGGRVGLGVGESLLGAVGMLVCGVLYVLLFLIDEWSQWAYVYHDYPDGAPAIDWADVRWGPVRYALLSAGYELASVRAVSVFRMDGNLRAIHRPRFSPGRLGRWSAASVPHMPWLRWLGALVGVGVYFLLPGLTAQPWLVPALLAVLVVMLPFAVVNGTHQMRLNLLRSHTVIEIPTGWRVSLRTRPQLTPTFLHEMSHARHDDAGLRRVAGYVMRLAKIASWFDIAVVLAPPLEPVGLGVFAAAATCAMVGLSQVRRLHKTVQELRADAEACPDPVTARDLGETVASAESAQSTPTQRARLHALTHNWADPLTRQYRRTLTLLGIAFASPVIGLVVL
jgi:hypothetical protein